MRILVVTQYFWPESFRINDLAKDLQTRGHEVTIFTGLPNYPKGVIFSGYCKFCWQTEDYEGVTIKRVPLFPRGKGGSFRLALNYFSFALFSCVSAPFFLRGGYDVIFVYEPSPITVGLPAVLLKKIKNIPILFWVQDLWPESITAAGAVNSNLLINFISKLVNFIYHRCDLILVQSNAFITSISRFGIHKNKIQYFPNSAERIYKPIENKNSKFQAELPNGFLVIFAGNIGVAQAMGSILDAALLLKDISSIKWVIIGDGRNKNWFQEEVNKRKLGSCIFLIDQKPIEDMPYYFACADILLATLKKDPIFSLTVPSKVQSYLACGKPIVASIDGETARVIDESGGGLAVPAENAEELASAVDTMYKMTMEERMKMGVQGRKYFEENFESEKLVDQLENWMHDLT